jgi:hypothetical protein
MLILVKSGEPFAGLGLSGDETGAALRAFALFGGRQGKAIDAGYAKVISCSLGRLQSYPGGPGLGSATLARSGKAANKRFISLVAWLRQ